VGISFGRNHVSCPVRVAELPAGVHSPYPMMPVPFDRDMIAGLACIPMFMGRTDHNVYMDERRSGALEPGRDLLCPDCIVDARGIACEFRSSLMDFSLAE